MSDSILLALRVPVVITPPLILVTLAFTAAFAADAHASAQHFINNSEIEVVGVEETNAGDAGTMVTVTYK